MSDTALIAPSGKYRVVGVDTFDGTDWLEGDFDTRRAAIAHADGRGKGAVMMKLHVYNDEGEHVHEAGSF